MKGAHPMRWKRVSAIHHHLKKKTGCAHTNKHLGKLGVVRSLGDKHLHLFFDTHAMGCLVFSTVDLLADFFHVPFCFRLDAITNRLCKNTKSDMILSFFLPEYFACCVSIPQWDHTKAFQTQIVIGSCCVEVQKVSLHMSFETCLYLNEWSCTIKRLFINLPS